MAVGLAVQVSFKIRDYIMVIFPLFIGSFLMAFESFKTTLGNVMISLGGSSPFGANPVPRRSLKGPGGKVKIINRGNQSNPTEPR